MNGKKKMMMKGEGKMEQMKDMKMGAKEMKNEKMEYGKSKSKGGKK